MFRVWYVFVHNIARVLTDKMEALLSFLFKQSLFLSWQDRKY